MDHFVQEEPNSTTSAAFVELPSNNEPTPQTRGFQAAAYDTLIKDGGRPSHPLGYYEEILSSPGRYRDILAFWQDHPNDWQVFHKQLSRWQAFRAHQRVSRDADSFKEYVLDLRERLDRHGFELPKGHRTPPHGISLEIEKQSKVAIWIEYINYEFSRRDENEKWLEIYRSSYDAALAQLMDARFRTPSSDICRPSGLEVARRKEESQEAEEECEPAKKRIKSSDPLDQTQTPRQTEKFEREYEEAMLRPKAINDRGLANSEFGQKVHAYRSAMDRSERHELLLRWATDQIPLIEEETRQIEQRDAVLRERSGFWQQAETFPQFQRLPPEIRHRIWEEMLPEGPSVHFFSVLNGERRLQPVSSWSSDEFRVRATKRRDSGYLAVYTLLATCRESRRIVEMYYIRRRRGVTCPLSGSAINFSDKPPDFQSFDWIPSNDLLVLCFPPVQVAQLPSGNAFTLAPGPNQAARRLGIMISKELTSMTQVDPTDDGESADGAAQLALIPEFINNLQKPTLRGSQAEAIPRGIWKLYLIVEGWTTNHIQMQLTAKVDSKKPVGDWADGLIHWRSPSALRGGGMLPWKSISQPTPGPELPLGTIINIMHNNPAFFNNNFNQNNQRIIHHPAPESNDARQLYWLGSRRPALGTIRPDDFVQQYSAEKLHDFVQILEMQCRAQQWHDNFGGVEALGWLEPASKSSLTVAEVRDLEQIAQRTGRWPRAFLQMRREIWE